MASVDDSRLKMIDPMTQDQRDMFLIGMLYHSAHLTFEEQFIGVTPSGVRAVELNMVIKAMDSHGLVSKINVKNSDK